MKKPITLATVGIFLLSLHLPGLAQKEVEAPAVPPILEGQRPLERPETAEPTPPKKLEGEKVKAKGKTRWGKRAGTKSRLKKQTPDKQVAAKKKGKKAQLKKGANSRSKKVALSNRMQ